MTIVQIASRRSAKAKRRRLQDEAFLREEVKRLGEDVVRAVLLSVIQDSEEPFARLPAKERDQGIAGFRAARDAMRKKKKEKRGKIVPFNRPSEAAVQS
jgi:hypothetical protein